MRVRACVHTCERKRLLVSVKSKQKNFSKWPSVKGKDHRFSLLLVTRLLRNEPSVLSVCLGNFTGEWVKKKRERWKEKKQANAGGKN